MIKVKYNYTNKTYTINKKKAKVKDILRELNILSTTVIVKKNNKIITEEDEVKDEEEIEVIRIVSGG